MFFREHFIEDGGKRKHVRVIQDSRIFYGNLKHQTRKNNLVVENRVKISIDTWCFYINLEKRFEFANSPPDGCHVENFARTRI